MGGSPRPATWERAFVEITQWLGRVLQYSIRHPSAVELGERAHQTLLAALQEHGPLDVGVLRENLVVDGVAAVHPVVRTRTAPYLHERGVLLLQFGVDVRADELTAFVELLAGPVHELFARGGLRRLLPERGVLHVRVEEIAHDLTAEERTAERRRKRVGDAFRSLVSRVLARRGTSGASREELAELLEDPDLAAREIEAEENVCEAVAGLVLMAIHQQRQSGVLLEDKMRRLLLALTPGARAKVFLGFPSLAGDFREALATIFAGFGPTQLARFAFPCLAQRPPDLERTLYVLATVTASGARRAEVLRRLAAMLHDLPLEEPENLALLGELSASPADDARYVEERGVIARVAERVTSDSMLFDAPALPREGRPDSFAPASLDRLSHREAMEIVSLGAKMVDFDDFCAKLPRAAEYLAGIGGTAAISGLFRALREVENPEWRGAAAGALRGIARSDAAIDVVREIGSSSAPFEGERLEETTAVLKLLARERPEPLLDLLSRTDSRKVRRILLDLLPEAGDALLPLVRARLNAPEWYVVRNMVTLVRRAGGGAAELRLVARHAQAQVRLEVMRALGGLRDPRAVDLLVAFLSDPAPEVRAGALSQLGDVELAEPAIHTLADLASNPQREDDTSHRAIALLGRSRLDVAAQCLAALVEPRGLFESAQASALRDRAAVALRRSPAPLAAQLFAEGLSSTKGRVRKAFERAAEGLGDG